MAVPRSSEVEALDRELNNLSVDDIIGIACKLLHSMEGLQSLELKFEISSTVNWLLLRAWQKDRAARQLQEWRDMGRRQHGRPVDDTDVEGRFRARAAKETRGGGPSVGVLRRSADFPPLVEPTLKHNPFAEALRRVQEEKELVVLEPNQEAQKVHDDAVSERDGMVDGLVLEMDTNRPLR